MESNKNINQEPIKIQKLIQNFQPISEVGFTYMEDMNVTLLQVTKEVKMSDAELAEYGIRNFHLESLVDSFDDEQMKKVIKEARRIKSLENVGGSGISKRRLIDIEKEIPGVSKELHTSAGKIVFLGNGLSTAPIEILKDRQSLTGGLPELVIVDMFDYSKLFQDLQSLKTEFSRQGMEFPTDLGDYLGNCSQLVEVIKTGKIKALKYAFGDGQVPDEAKDADIAVNSYGPPNSTLHEQIQCLKVGGRLFNSSRDIHETSGIYVKPLVTDDGVVATIVTRTN